MWEGISGSAAFALAIPRVQFPRLFTYRHTPGAAGDRLSESHRFLKLGVMDE